MGVYQTEVGVTDWVAKRSVTMHVAGADTELALKPAQDVGTKAVGIEVRAALYANSEPLRRCSTSTGRTCSSHTGIDRTCCIRSGFAVEEGLGRPRCVRSARWRAHPTYTHGARSGRCLGTTWSSGFPGCWPRLQTNQESPIHREVQEILRDGLSVFGNKIAFRAEHRGPTSVRI